MKSRKAPTPSQPRLALWRRALRWLRDSLTMAALMLAVLVLSVRLLVPLLGHYKPEAEARLSALLGIEVQARALDIKWTWTGPQLAFEEVTVGLPIGVQVGELSLRLNAWQMLREWRLTTDDISLSDLSLHLQRDTQGQWILQGLPLPKGQGSTDWGALMGVFHRIRLSQVALTFEDLAAEHRQQALLEEVYLERQQALLGARAVLVIPGVTDGQLQLSGVMELSESGWQGDSHVSLRTEHLDGLAPWLPSQWRQWSLSGQSEIQLWMRWQNSQLDTAYAEYAFENLYLSNGQADVPAWEAQLLSGDMQWQAREDGGLLTLSPVLSRKDNPWDSGYIRIDWTRAASGLELAASGQLLQLQDVAELLQLWPQREAAWVAALRQLQPKGVLTHWQVRRRDGQWQQAHAGGQGLSWQPYEKIPGLDGLSGHVQWKQGQGRLRLASENLRVDAPTLFRHPLPVEQLKGDVLLSHRDAIWHLQTQDLQLQTPHIRSQTQAKVRWPVDSGAEMDVRTQFFDGDGRFVSLYLPTKVMKAPLVKWLDQGIVEGRVPQGQLVFRGNSRDFPFREGGGALEVDFAVQGATVRFHPKWQPATDIEARLRISTTDLSADVHSARVHGVNVREAQVKIDDFRNATVVVDGRGQSDMPTFLQFAQQGPLKHLLSPAFRDTSGQGPLALDLEVRHRLRKGEKTQLQGTVQLQDNALNFRPFRLPLKQLNGQVQFDQHSVNVKQLKAHFLGVPIRADLSMPKAAASERVLRVDARGRLSVSDYLQHMGWQKWDDFSGRSDWRVRVDVPLKAGRVVTLRADSDLVGTAVQLPAPLAKPSKQAKALKLNLRIPSPGGGAWPLRVDYGRQAKVAVNLGPKGRQLAGLHAAFGRPQGVAAEVGEFFIQGRVGYFDADAWIAWGARHSGGGSGKTPSLHERIELQAETLQVLNRRLSQADLRWTQETEGAWRLAVEHRHLAGEAHGQKRQSQLFLAPIRVKLARLDLALLDLPQVLPEQGGKTLKPRDLPDMQVKVERLLWGKQQLNNLSLKGRRAGERYWLDRIRVSDHAYNVRGQGQWSYDGQKHRSSVSLVLKTEQLGQMLSDFGYAQTLAEGHGEAAFDFNWQAPLYTPNLKSLSGEAAFTFKDGRILAVEPGAGRLVGLLAFQELPRRLTLNFSDMLKRGLEFDEIVGRFRFVDGLATTQRTLLNGPVGLVELQGSVDYLQREYDQTLTILPQLTASLPIIGALTGGIATGVGVLVADGVLKTLGVNFDEIGKKVYRLEGSWASPSMTDVTPKAEPLSNQNDDR